jgi:hypothetical protein
MPLLAARQQVGVLVDQVHRPKDGLPIRRPLRLCGRAGRSFGDGVHSQHGVDRRGELLAIVSPAQIGELARVPAGQRLQIRGQLRVTRHASALDERGNDPDVAPCQRCSDLDPDEVVRIVQAAHSVFAACVDPLPSDHDDHDAALAQDQADAFGEILPRTQGREVEEDVLAAVAADENVDQSARMTG